MHDACNLNRQPFGNYPKAYDYITLPRTNFTSLEIESKMNIDKINELNFLY